MASEAKRRRVKEVQRIKVHGAWHWQARVAYQGERRSQLCDTEDEAKQAKADLLQKLVKATEQEAQANAAPATLALVCDAYLLDLEARGKNADSLSTARNAKARLADFFGPRMHEPLSLTAADLYAYRAHRLRQWAKRGKKAKDGTTAILPGGAKASTINRDLRTIRAMLKKALPTFRFPAGVFLKEDENRVKWLKPEDELVVFLTMPAPFGDMARLAAITMMRLTEIRTLRREQVDLSQGIVRLPQTKTEPRHVVLNREAQGILARGLSGLSHEWVFPSPTDRPYSRHYVGKVWRRAARAAGLVDFHFHDLRHHGATMILNAGFSGSVVQDAGRWKSDRMMRRYAAVTDQTLRAAMEATSRGSKLRQQAGKPAIMHATP